MPRRCRSTFTRDTRRIPDSCSGVSGWASGSDSAAATTSPSVTASSRAQSVSLRVDVLPGFIVTRVVPVLFMSCGLSGRYDLVAIFAMQCSDHEQDVAARQSDDLNSLLAVSEPRADFFQTVRIFKGSNRIRKI